MNHSRKEWLENENKLGHKQLRPENPKETLLRLFSYFKFNKALFFLVEYSLLSLDLLHK